MWETTFARNAQAGFCKDFSTLSYTKEHIRFVNLLTKSGLGISRKCCFPHGIRLDLHETIGVQLGVGYLKGMLVPTGEHCMRTVPRCALQCVSSRAVARSI